MRWLIDMDGVIADFERAAIFYYGSNREALEEDIQKLKEALLSLA